MGLYVYIYIQVLVSQCRSLYRRWGSKKVGENNSVGKGFGKYSILINSSPSHAVVFYLLAAFFLSLVTPLAKNRIKTPFSTSCSLANSNPAFFKVLYIFPPKSCSVSSRILLFFYPNPAFFD